MIGRGRSLCPRSCRVSENESQDSVLAKNLRIGHSQWVWECPNKELKKVKERKRNGWPWVAGTIMSLLKPEAVVSLNENNQDRLKIFQLSRETPAAPGQSRDIMAQISIDTLHCECVIFIVNIENMLSWKDHIQISGVPVGTIIFRLSGCVYHLLDGSGGLIPAHSMTYDLPRFSTYHRYDVDIFPCFGARLVLHKPVQLI